MLKFKLSRGCFAFSQGQMGKENRHFLKKEMCSLNPGSGIYQKLCLNLKILPMTTGTENVWI